MYTVQPRLSGLVGTEQNCSDKYSPDKRGRFIHSGIGMGLVSMFG